MPSLVLTFFAVTSVAAASAPSSQEANERLDALESALEELRDTQMAAAAQHMQQPDFHLYGFMELTYQEYDAEPGSIFDAALDEYPSFMTNHINIYSSFRIDESLQALVEIAYTFAPHGSERSLRFDAVGTPYDRVDTSLTHRGTGELLTLGGLSIPRAHFTWQLLDDLSLTFGRFLTPFGIWNVDHGSPAHIPVRAPWFQLQKLVPTEQTGLLATTRYLLGDTLAIDAIATLSNGRGPLDAVHDLDRDKATGMRLRLTHDSADLFASLGGYFYRGWYTDREGTVVTLSPFTIDRRVTERFRETSITVDALLEIAGLRIQLEGVRTLVRYAVRPPHPEWSGLSGRVPDNVTWASYALISYSHSVGSWQAAPYAVHETYLIDYRKRAGTVCTFGLNVKPLPALVLKTEYSKVRTPNVGKTSLYVVQVSVAF